MFTEFTQEYYDDLNKVREAANALTAALNHMNSTYHSSDDNILDTEDLTALDYFTEDLDGFVKDEIVTLMNIHEGLRDGGRPPRYEFDMGLKYGSLR
jgi:hypothetical protein